jgi:hypothetical protein
VAAGVQAGAVVLFHADERGLQSRPLIRGHLADAVACFHTPATSELLVVAEQGDVVCLPCPE